MEEPAGKRCVVKRFALCCNSLELTHDAPQRRRRPRTRTTANTQPASRGPCHSSIRRCRNGPTTSPSSTACSRCAPLRPWGLRSTVLIVSLVCDDRPCRRVRPPSLPSPLKQASRSGCRSVLTPRSPRASIKKPSKSTTMLFPSSGKLAYLGTFPCTSPALPPSCRLPHLQSAPLSSTSSSATSSTSIRGHFGRP